jgi:hypothetical protein
MIKTIIAVFAAAYLLPAAANAQSTNSGAMPHVIVYKTKSKYRNLVPVQLSEDKKTIISYPAPGDVTTGSGYPLPVALHKGYFLDKRGVNLSTAFLRLTYAQYSKLKEVPSPDELYQMIVDKEPIKELCDCGTRRNGAYSVRQLNELIDTGKLKKKCKSAK